MYNCTYAINTITIHDMQLYICIYMHINSVNRACFQQFIWIFNNHIG